MLYIWESFIDPSQVFGAFKTFKCACFTGIWTHICLKYVYITKFLFLLFIILCCRLGWHIYILTGTLVQMSYLSSEHFRSILMFAYVQCTISLIVYSCPEYFLKTEYTEEITDEFTKNTEDTCAMCTLCTVHKSSVSWCC